MKIEFDIPEWKLYEDYIFQTLSEKYPNCSLTSDDHVYGNFSRANRQVDISIRGTLYRPLLAAP